MGVAVGVFFFQAEVGIRDAQESRGLGDVYKRQDLDAMEDVPITSEVWLKAAHLGHTLRHQGLTVPLPDLLIAQVALEEKLWLWHADEHFEYIKEIIPLKTRPFIKGK